MTTLASLAFKWTPIGSISPENLVAAREELHQAVQLIAAAGKYLIPERPDDSQTSMTWNDQLLALTGEVIGAGESTLQIGLRMADVALLIIKSDVTISNELPLKGNTLVSTLEWMKNQINDSGIDSSGVSLQLHYDLPAHSLKDGSSFLITNAEEYKEVALYFSNASHVLKAVSNMIPNASEVRCWPHHFDLATLITIDADTLFLHYTLALSGYS
jgi:hypothetical protein